MDKNIDNIEGDGFLFPLFHLLWLKDPVLGIVPSLNVPDTILFKYDQPYIWYFVKDKCLKRKSKSKLNLEEIHRNFLKKAPKSGIVALYISQYSLTENKEKIIYEYMNRIEFEKFLFSKQANSREGVLQRFIQPKTDHNFILRAIWGPTICLFEKIENLNNVNDVKHDVYQRALTFETDNTPSRNVPVRGYILPQKLENFVFNMVQHISNVTYDRLQVVRMVCNFKIDEQDRIWFLFCSSLRLKNPSSVLHKYYNPEIQKAVYNTQQIEINVPPNIETQKLSHPQPLNLRRNFRCLNCEKEIDVQGLFKITYKHVIRGWNFDHYDQKEAWDVMRSLSPFEIGSENTKINEGRLPNSNNSIKQKINKKLLNPMKNELLSKKVQNYKKNTQFVYKSLFNDFEREGPDNHFFAIDSKNDLIYESLVPIEKGYAIPPLIKSLHPHLKEREYRNLVKNPGFLEKKALVCEDCYLMIIASSNASESLKQMTKKHFITNHEIVGKGKLNPEQINYRNELTRSRILSQINSETIDKARICRRNHGDGWCVTEEDLLMNENESNHNNSCNKTHNYNIRFNDLQNSQNDIKINNSKTPQGVRTEPNFDSVTPLFHGNDKIKGSGCLNRMLGTGQEVKRIFMKHNLTKLEFSSSVLKRSSENGQGMSFEKNSTVETSGKETFDPENDKKDNDLHFPKMRYLTNLSKQLNAKNNEVMTPKQKNASSKSFSQFNKLYDSTKEKLKLTLNSTLKPNKI